MAAEHRSDRRVAEQFETFSQAVGAEMPLYAALGRAIVDDPELLALAGGATPGQPPPNMLFGAVQYLLLGGVEHSLAAWYPAVSGSAPPREDPVPAFRDFCVRHRNELADLISNRRTQTNEVARCLALLPALTIVSEQARVPLALVELGASAGLLLAFDRYHYTYGSETWGPEDSPVRLTTELRGASPSLRPALNIETRVGIDLHPVDVTSETETRWLEAMVWPGHEERRSRLRAALGLVRPDPPPLLAGDALALLPGLLESIPPARTPVVFHSFTLIQWTSEQRARLAELLRSAGRPVFRIWLEWFGFHRKNLPLIRLFDYRDGAESSETLGQFHHHGRWLDWGRTDP